MHFPINIPIGSATINSHLVFEMLAYSLGFQYYLSIRRRFHDWMSFDNRITIIIAAALGALVGSRLVGYFSLPQTGLESFKMILVHLISNKSILGGLVGGVLSVEIVKKFLGIQKATGDLFVYPIILGMIIGRIGCFSQGVFDGTHGIPTHLPWAMDMGDGVLRHPAQLYEIIFLGVIWILIKNFEQRLREGVRFKVFVMSYIIFRFLTEWIKPVNFDFFGLSAVQVACILGCVYYLPFLLNPKNFLKEKNAESKLSIL